MNQENTMLPENFDGVFRFTNFTDEDFSTMWNNVEYTFPKTSTTPIIITSESLENIQNIRRRFAYRLAQKAFYESDRYHSLNALTQKQGIAPTIDMENDPVFIELVQKCLEPLPVGKVTTRKVPKEEIVVSEHTKAIDQKDSLKANASDVSFDSMPAGE